MSVRLEFSDGNRYERPQILRRSDYIIQLLDIIRYEHADLQNNELNIPKKVYFVYLKLALYQLRHKQIPEAIQSLKLSEKADPDLHIGELIEGLEAYHTSRTVNKVARSIAGFLKHFG